MAVRVSASSQNYSTTLSLGSQTKCSVTCWVKLSADRNTESTVWWIQASGVSDSLAVSTDAGGEVLGMFDNGSFILAGPLMTVGTWYFVGLAYDAGAYTMITRALGASSFSKYTASLGASSHTMTSLFIQNGQAGGGGGPYLNGCVTAFKGWIGVAMTDAQLQNEAWTHLPRYPNPTFWYPLLVTETVDYSGNGRTLTGGTGATIEDGPGVGWGWRRTRPPIKDTIELVAGQASSTETAGIIEVQHIVGTAVETNVAVSTQTVVVVDTVEGINTAVEIVDPIAIGVTALTSSTAAASAQSWSTASITPTGNRLVLLAVDWAASTAVVASPIASVTGNGLTWELVLGQNYGAATGTTNARRRMEVWRALGPAPTAGAITITHAAAQPAINRCWSVFEMNSTDLSGSNGSGAIRQTASNRSTAATTLTATLGAFGNAKNATVGFGGGQFVMTVGTGFTSIAIQRVSTSPTVSLLTEWFLGIDTTVNCNQGSSGQLGVIGIEIKYRFVEPLTGPPFETDTARSVIRPLTRTLGQAIATDASRALVVVRTKAMGQASEISVVHVIVRPILAAPVAQTTETETARVLTSLKTKTLGMASLANVAQSVASIKTLGIGLATDVQTARAFTAAKTAAIVLATESTSAQALARLKARAVGQAMMTEVAQVLTRVKAQALGQASGLDLARTLTIVKGAAVAQAMGMMAARAITAVRVKAIGTTTGIDAARSLAAPIGLIQVTEPEHARDVVSKPSLSALVGQAAEMGGALPVAFIFTKVVAVGQVTTTNVAAVVSLLRHYPVSLAVESNTAQNLRRLLVEQTTESGAALTITFTQIGTVTLESAAAGGAYLGVEQAGSMLTSGPVGIVRTSVEHSGIELTVEQLGGARLTEEA